MRKHIDTKRKAELIQKAYNLRKHGYNLDSICKNLNVNRDSIRRWLLEYNSYLDGDKVEYKLINRCIPYFEKKQTELRTPKITILWGLIEIY